MQFAQIQLNKLIVRKNPRTYFDETALNELAESIKHNGVFTPILVRPAQGEGVEIGTFEIIAGERRFRASKMVFGEEGLIPAAIVDLNNSDASRAALIENTQREAMSATEEAKACGEVLYSCEGDKEEAARILGFSRSKFDARLLLLNLVDEVQGALNRREIALGHAELLSSVPKEKQVHALGVIQANKLSVEQTKTVLLKSTQQLSDAIFDKSGCNGCPHNSETQQSLLETSLGAGHCVNKECFGAKTNAELAIRLESLKEAYPRVEEFAGETGKVIIMLREDTVGSSQLNACKGCENYGAVLYTGAERTGESDSNMCFNAVCNAKKVAANREALKAVQAKPTTKAVAASEGKGNAKDALEQIGASGDDSDGIGGDSVEDSGQVVQEADEQRGEIEPVKPMSKLNKNAAEYRDKLWRKIVAKEIFGNRTIARDVLIAVAFSGRSGQISSGELAKRSEALLGCKISSTGGLGKAVDSVEAVDSEGHEKCLDAMAAVCAFGLTSLGDVEELARKYKFDISKHWQIKEEFLQLFTKSEIESICMEVGITDALGAEAMKKSLAGKKAELIAAILATPSFNWDKAIPQTMFA